MNLIEQLMFENHNDDIMDTQELSHDYFVDEYLYKIWQDLMDEYEDKVRPDIQVYLTDSKFLGNDVYEFTIQIDIGYEENWEWVNEEGSSFKAFYNTETTEINSEYKEEYED